MRLESVALVVLAEVWRCEAVCGSVWRCEAVCGGVM